MLYSLKLTKPQIHLQAAYIINGNCKNVMNMSQPDQSELWRSVLNGNFVIHLGQIFHFFPFLTFFMNSGIWLMCNKKLGIIRIWKFYYLIVCLCYYKASSATFFCEVDRVSFMRYFVLNADACICISSSTFREDINFILLQYSMLLWVYIFWSTVAIDGGNLCISCLGCCITTSFLNWPYTFVPLRQAVLSNILFLCCGASSCVTWCWIGCICYHNY